jgi:hypothetical protein
VGAFRPQRVCPGERLVEVAAELGSCQRGRLVHDRLGLVLEHGLPHRIRIEQIDPHGFRTECPQALRARRRVVGADHLVSGVDQLRNEPTADCTARTRYENTHRVPPLL